MDLFYKSISLGSRLNVSVIIGRLNIGNGSKDRAHSASLPGLPSVASQAATSHEGQTGKAMNFEDDAFISYAHLDNVALQKGTAGWVAKLHQDLENRVGVKLGKRPHIWRDPKLKGNDVFAERLVERLRRVASLVSVVSPAYIKGEWTRKELLEFWRAAEEQGGIQFGDKSRIFKVLKTKVPLERQGPELQSVLGYDFFKEDSASGKIQEFDENIYGPGIRHEYWARVEDLAHDISSLLEMLEGSGPTLKSEFDCVYLAETTSDLKDQRDQIKRDLVEHGHTVFPIRPLPLVASEISAAVRQDLAKCCMSIHLIGKCYSLVPEGDVHSLQEIQSDLAIERGEKGRFSRLMWIPVGLQVEDDRQQKVIEKLRLDPRIQQGADLLETSLEDLKTLIRDRLNVAPETKTKPRISAAVKENIPRVYMIYDQRDAKVASSWANYLFEQGFEVIRPVFEGDEAEIREYHEENLCTCDGVLILYGAADELWLARKQRELLKSPGYGRTKPKPVVAIALVPPETDAKKSLKTHESFVIPQWNGFSTDSEPLRNFISRLNV